MAERRARGFKNMSSEFRASEFKPRPPVPGSKKSSVEAAAIYMNLKQQSEDKGDKEDKLASKSSSRTNQVPQTQMASGLGIRFLSGVRMVRQCENCKTLFENAHICRKKTVFAKKPSQRLLLDAKTGARGGDCIGSEGAQTEGTSTR